MGEEWLGQWWRPGSDTRVGGQLELTDSGPRLALFGSLADWSGVDFRTGVGFPLKDPHRIPVVRGLAAAPLSVLGAWCDFPHPPGTQGTEVWFAEAIVDGRVESADAEPTFKGVRVRLPALPAWARARGLDRTYMADETTVTVRRHDLAEAALDDGTEIRIDQWANTHPGTRELTIRQPVTLTVRASVAATWADLLNTWIQPVQVLLWMASAMAGTIDEPEVLIEHDDPRRTKWGRLWVALVEDSGGSREVDRWDVLFFADEMPGGFAAGIERWLSMWNDLRHVIGPLYGRASAPFAYANDRLFTAVSAIEGYHRHKADSDRELDRQAHRARVARIDEILEREAPDLREWAVNAARPFNQIRLQHRIVRIADALPRIRERLFGESLAAFADAAEGSRHGEAHASDHAGAIDDGGSMYVAADALVWLLRASLLVDLGFDAEFVQDRVVANQRFIWTAEQARDLIADLTAS